MHGKSHAATGAAAGFGVAVAAGALTTGPTDLALLLAGTVTGAGAALLPDLDHPNSTVTHSQGPLTRSLGWVLRKLSRGAHALTRTRYDNDQAEHRRLTHTALFAAAMGVGVAAAAEASVWAAAGVVWFTASLALLGATAAFAPEVRLRSVTTWAGVSAGAGALAALVVVGGAASGAYLGACVTVGMIVHCLGDAVTKQACPLLWPLRICGKRWYEIGPPAVLRFSTGEKPSLPERIIAWASWAVPVVGTLALLYREDVALAPFI